jgi:SAM-dependent methyltransferase
VSAHDPSAYGRDVADAYDALYRAAFDTDGAVERLHALAEGGSILELGIGTGRLALPLAERGHEVVGVDASEEMLARLRAKPGAERLRLIHGDFEDVRLSERFGLVLITLNTLYALPDQESQVGCVLNASQHLRPGGTFVVEGFVLDAEKLHRDEGMQPRYLDEHRIELQFMRHDRATQRLHNILVSLGPDGVLVRPVNHRYIWPSELDLMARLAGLRLAERWGGWRGEPYTSASPLHVSVYRA